MNSKIYLSGPMTGIQDYNFPAFNAAAKRLREAGHTVFNPAENGLPKEAAWEDHMRADIKQLMDCNTIYMLEGWQKSKGANLELLIAQSLGMVVSMEGQV